ncbi:hypothetical protein DRO54_00685 [Candidatus Bathyarchaeota archaeon]|nr:MAG: hypothetical protein DRO54_00685 [Candidatus Bathyarchaeota archaeon]
MKILKGRVIVSGGRLQGEALVSRMPISFLGGVDPATGVIIEKGHDLNGKCVKDKILCFPHGHGSTVGSYVMYALAKNGLAPRAILNEKADPVVVVGAVLAEIPMMDKIKIEEIRTGDILEIDCEEGIVKILESKPCI